MPTPILSSANSLLTLIWLMVATTPLPAFEIYRTPVAPERQPGDNAMSCQTLEREIAALLPSTYSFKPGFYQDPYHGASLTVGTTIGWPAYGVLGYSVYVDYRERQRMFRTQERIATLRELKAEKHCFED